MTTQHPEPASTEAADLRLTRVLDAPRDLVWRAWTESERMARWWGPHGFTAPVCTLDVRPGGAIHIDMHGPDGVTYPLTGTFREVVPPERLVFDSAALDAEGRPLFQVRNTITFAAEGERTTVSVHAQVLTATGDAAPYLARAEVGWSQQMERLRSHVEAGATSFAVRDREVVATRTFDAPKWLVYHAWSRPEHLARWWGPHGFTNSVEAMDVRPGGEWRITQTATDGSLHTFFGVYREVSPPDRLVFTQRYAPLADQECEVAIELSERQGRTEMTLTTRFASTADRDAMVGGGMEWGFRQSLDRLVADLGAAGVGPESPWEREIVASRILHAPRELLWRVWTDPADLAHWWGPNGFATTTKSMDVRPGGAWRLVMRGPDGVDYDSEMVYAEVRRPERLVYEHVVPPPFRQEVTFTDLGEGRTRVTVRSTFASASDVQPYAIEGMRQTLGRLREMVAGAA